MSASLNEAVDAIQGSMRRLPAGDIVLRDDRKKTTWTVALPAFLMASTPVTQLQYTAVTGASPFAFSGPARPAESVSWFDAIHFCNRLSAAAGFQACYAFDDEDKAQVSIIPDADGYRLPTDAEWEYACRAGTRDVRHGPLAAIAWFRENADEQTHPVGLKQPNAWGLYDMLGNVWEWCWDLYDPQVYGEYRIFRGGAWFDPARGCLASNRRRSHPTYRIDDLGFRLARSLPKQG